jgi:hypothetical protein
MMGAVMTWVGPTLDAVVVVLLAAVLWRLGREPAAAWSACEARLQTIFDDLRTLVAQSEGLARELDGTLVGHAERLRALLAEAQAVTGVRSTGAGVTPAATPVRSTRGAAGSDTSEARPVPADRGPIGTSEGEPAAVVTRIEALADAGIAVDEIARRLGIATADVRVVIGLSTARAARRRAVSRSAEARLHA